MITTDPEYPIESQGVEIIGGDGKTHFVWATNAYDAYQSAAKWGYRHDGFTSVALLVLLPGDDSKGCWDRAKRIPFGRNCRLGKLVHENQPHQTA